MVVGVWSRRRLPTTSKEFKVGGRWIRVSKHIDCTRKEEELGDVNRFINSGVAIDGFFDIIGGMSSEVTTSGFASLDNKGLRTWKGYIISSLSGLRTVTGKRAFCSERDKTRSRAANSNEIPRDASIIWLSCSGVIPG